MPQIFSRSRTLRTLSGLTLEPGANDVSDADWAKASASSYAQTLITRGFLVVRETPKPAPDDAPVPDGVPVTLSALGGKAALDVVARTTNIDQLKEWFETDGRKSVKSAIVKRRYELEPKPADEDEAKARENTEPRVE